jgi:hypothetical protein
MTRALTQPRSMILLVNFLTLLGLWGEFQKNSNSLESMALRYLASYPESLVHNALMVIYALAFLGLIAMLRFTRKLLALPLVFLTLLNLTASFWSETFVSLSVAPLDQALRFGPALILLFFLGAKKEEEAFDSGLLLFLSLTFLGHGIECWMMKAEFQDFLWEFLEGKMGLTLPEFTVPYLLYAIGLMDLNLAWLSLNHDLGARWKTLVFLQMFLWGSLTSFERIFYYGDSGFFLLIERSAHIIVPFYFLISNLKFVVGKNGAQPQLVSNSILLKGVWR